MSIPITRADWDSRLKHAQDQAQRATKAELARNYSEAFELYVRAGQLFVWLLGNYPTDTTGNNASITASAQRAGAGTCAETVLIGSSPDTLSGASAAQTRERLKQMATKVMARAEKIKATHKHLRPVDRDALSQEEQSTILVSSSLINGLRYPIWSGSSSQLQPASVATFTQHTQPQLSPIQRRKGALYKRASEEAKAQDQGWSKRLQGSDIVQDIVTDCSFVAALEAAAEHDRIFGGQLATSALYPQDSAGRIQPSSIGQYHVKLHINGAPRIVTIDDHLPYYPLAEPSADGERHRLMCATSRDGSALWPALLEKAYLQVMGGYDFAGSNSSIDLYALTGWLPEHIFLRHAGFQREKTWTRLLAAWSAGKCIATAGTAKASRAAGSSDEAVDTIMLESGLISSHNYAILDVRASGSRRLVKLMNPWRTAAGIRPAIAISAEEEKRAYGGQDKLELELDRLSVKEAAIPPTFTVSWDDFCSHFDSLFLNWDPKMFDNTVTVHSSWRGSLQPSSETRQAEPHFRLSVTMPSSVQGSTVAAADPSSEIWLLLTRHITDTRSSQHAAEKSNQPSSQYIALHAFEDDHQASESGKLAPSPLLHKAKHKGAYVDGTHCLVRLKPSLLRETSRADSTQRQRQCSFTVVASRRSEGNVPFTSPGSASDVGKAVNYTLSVFSPYQMQLSELRTRLPFSETISGSWTARTAGGNATLPTFLSNPQYTLVVPEGGVQVQVTLESSDRRLPIQVLLAYPGTGTGRVTHLTEGDVVLSSGMYHHGMALCCGALRAGNYTVVVSTFEAGMTGEFALSVESTNPVTIKSIAQEGAGMFYRRLVGTWRRGVNAAGSPANKGYWSNPGWKFTMLERSGPTAFIARIKVEAAKVNAVRPYVNLALFVEEAGGGLREVASSGGYTDLTCGASIDKVNLSAATYRLIASTYNADTEAEFSVDLYTAVKVDVVAV